MDFETDEPASILQQNTAICTHDARKRAYYQREDGRWLYVCEIDGITGEDHILPPGFAPKGIGGRHSFSFSNLAAYK